MLRPGLSDIKNAISTAVSTQRIDWSKPSSICGRVETGETLYYVKFTAFDDVPVAGLKLFLQFFQPSLDAIRREGVGADHGLGDIGLQLFQEGAALCQNLIDGIDRDILQQELVYRPIGAVCICGARFQSADAAPDDGLATVVVPVDTPVKLAAVSAENHLCKTVIA